MAQQRKAQKTRTSEDMPATAPIVFSTFGKLSSVRTPSPPTAGPQENGPELKSMNAHLKKDACNRLITKDQICGQKLKKKKYQPILADPCIRKTFRIKTHQVTRF